MDGERETIGFDVPYGTAEIGGLNRGNATGIGEIVNHDHADLARRRVVTRRRVDDANARDTGQGRAGRQS